MKVPYLDLRRQTRELRVGFEAAFRSVLDAGSFILGEGVDPFESSFAAYCGARECVGVASGTDAISLALRAGGVGPGDEVIAPALTCVPTVAAISAIGARPVLVDVDPRTVTLDPGKLESALTEKTRAIVPVHLYGQCAEMNEIVTFARRNGLLVIEDASQAHGAEYRGRRTGTLADAAAFSFYPTKNLGALGDAGAVVTDQPTLAKRLRYLRAQGEEAGRGATAEAVHSRLDELQAGLLLVKLPRLEGWIARREEIAKYYRRELEEQELTLPAEADDRRHVFHIFAARSARRDELRVRVSAGGVETFVHYPRAVHQHPAYAELAHNDLRCSEQAAARFVSPPLFPELSDLEVEAVAATVDRALCA